MSDKLEDIDKLYHRDVRDHVPRTFALFPIPEYPELESGEGMWSVCLDGILTALRYLAPATLLTLFWGQQSFLFRILRHIDLAIRAIVFSSDEQKQSVLKWIAEAGPVRVEQLDTVWRHGWILCGVLDAALPGACAGHPPTRQTLKHAQTIADHYLGVDPVFSRQELESNDCLSKHQEWKFAHYLDRIRTALSKIPPPVSKPASQRTSPEAMQFTLDYIARGSGLIAAQVNNKMFFKVYPTGQQSLEPGEVTVLIRGPRDTYGMVVIPPILGKAQTIRQKLLNLQSERQYTENVLPITQGATYLRTYGRNDMNKTYHIPKTKYDIEMDVETCEEYAKVGYLVNIEGKYEISIVSRGQSIVGSPFTVTASNNIIGTLERESFCLEDGEEIDIVDVKTERKVVLRIVDFVTEKMLLRENGELEKISNDEANVLMATDKTEKKVKKSDLSSQEYVPATICREDANLKIGGRFKQAVEQVKSLIRACKIFNETLQVNKRSKRKEEEVYIRPKSRLGIPDVVNSTLNDTIINPYATTENFDHVLKPDNYSIKKHYTDSETSNQFDNARNRFRKSNLELSMKAKESINPFTPVLDELSLSSETKCAYEIKDDPSHISEIDGGLDNLPIKIIIQDDNESISPTTNPFIEPEMLERPKTPVLKIINGEVQDRVDSVYVDPHIEKITEEILGNEFINPFFMHQHQGSSGVETQDPVTTFIIGAPVSLPPILTASSPDPNLSSLIITSNDQSIFCYESNENKQSQPLQNEELSFSVFSTPLHVKLEQNSITSSKFHSLDSNVPDNSEEIISNSENNMLKCNKNINSTKKDIWDSAYVSIDENNSSPDSNNNDNTAVCEASCKAKFPPSEEITLKPEDFIKMGPAEKELWNSCAELTNTVPNNAIEELKSSKWERRPIFTPIIEENDRSISRNLKESDKTTNPSETDPVTVAFAELDDIFQEYNSISEQSSLTTSGDYILDHSYELDYTIETDDMRVKSASERVSDVMRPTTIKEEGEISEVQPNVTESVSVSQTLRFKTDNIESTDLNYHIQTKFGDSNQTNIVIEKKKYWDERIREIEENRSEQAKKKRLISKNLRHNDSLTKRRGKQMVKNFLVASEADITSPVKTFENPVKYGPQPQTTPEEHSDVKLVEKWKKYWDEKLDTEKDEIQVGCFKASLNKNRHEKSLSPKPDENSEDETTISNSNVQYLQSSNNTAHFKEFEINLSKKFDSPVDILKNTLSEAIEIREMEPMPFTLNEDIPTDIREKRSSYKTLPVKQELPEEVFKAFETSPKRFFGTSRKQILNKIDAFLGNPSTAVEVTTGSGNISGASNEKGLVSSRVSMFHDISHVEKLPWKSDKNTSILNIQQVKNFENNNNLIKYQSVSPKTSKISATENTVQNKIKTNATKVSDLDPNNQWKGSNSTSILNLREQKDSENNNNNNNIITLKSQNVSPETFEEVDQKNSIHHTVQSSLYESENSLQVHEQIRKLNLAYNKCAKNIPTSVCEESTLLHPTLELETNVQKTAKDMNIKSHKETKYVNNFRKSAVSKSEMDIFSKITNVDQDDNLEKHKSYEVLPNINVKNFINMYETVTKTAKSESKPLLRKMSRSSSVGSEKLARIISSISEMSAESTNFENTTLVTNQHERVITSTGPKTNSPPDIPKPPPRKRRDISKSSQESLDIGNSVESLNEFKSNKYVEFQNNNTRKERYVSLSDIEVEIVENYSENMCDSSPEHEIEVKDYRREKDKTDPIDYKSRFKLAKQYFQSLEELRAEDMKQIKLNECEQLLLNVSSENKRPQKRVKKNIKSRSMDSSELANIWSQMQTANDENEMKLVKISEKFNVEDLFTDVTEGKLSRQGSLRGIPHKKAVLEAFRSMENVSDTKLSSYEIAVSQLTDFAKENHIKNVQTYLTEYPYLPTTEPSKYHSRLDAKASGLISMKELLTNKQRRNSVPDIRINPKFSVEL